MRKPEALIRVRGARVHNLRGIDIDIPRDVMVVFTGISGSGKTSLAFGTLFAESQRRYLDSVSPYARRMIEQVAEPDVDDIAGLPPAVALAQRRGTASTRSSVGSVTTISNRLRMLYSRAGVYPRGQGILYADAFSPNTPDGACPRCHGIGRVFDVTEALLVPDPRLTIRERAVAAWPPAWQGQNFRDILVSLGHDVDKPWKKLPKKLREWILYTDEHPVVPVFAGYTPEETREAVAAGDEPSYMGTFSGARRYILDSFAKTQSALTKRRVERFMELSQCPQCRGKQLKPESLSVTFTGLDIAELSRLCLDDVAQRLAPFADAEGAAARKLRASDPARAAVAERICRDIVARIRVVAGLGLGYLALQRVTPSLSPGELQRLRLATQIRSRLFGVVYVLDEPSAGLHPADTDALLLALEELREAGNSLFLVEHDVSVIERADWIVDLGPGAGQRGGNVVYSGPVAGLRDVPASHTRPFVFDHDPPPLAPRRTPHAWLELREVRRNNVAGLDARIPLGVLVAVTGVSGSGKSSLVSQALADVVGDALGTRPTPEIATGEGALVEHEARAPASGQIAGGLEAVGRLVTVDQKPIGRTPRSNLATYTGLFDHVRKLFAGTTMARARRYNAGRFSFNVAKGRCKHCEGAGFVSVELLFMPSVYAPCQVCAGKRYNDKTLEVEYRGKNIAAVLDLTVESAHGFFEGEAPVLRSVDALLQVGLGYLRLGQPATELSGGEAQRIKLATELQRVQRGDTLYLLDEPTTGLHPFDVERLMQQLSALVDAGNTVVAVVHDMQVAARADWVIDMGPGAGERGGKIVAQGPPAKVAKSRRSRTAPYLRRALTSAAARS